MNTSEQSRNGNKNRLFCKLSPKSQLVEAPGWKERTRIKLGNRSCNLKSDKIHV